MSSFPPRSEGRVLLETVHKPRRCKAKKHVPFLTKAKILSGFLSVSANTYSTQVFYKSEVVGSELLKSGVIYVRTFTAILFITALSWKQFRFLSAVYYINIV